MQVARILIALLVASAVLVAATEVEVVESASVAQSSDLDTEVALADEAEEALAQSDEVNADEEDEVEDEADEEEEEEEEADEESEDAALLEMSGEADADADKPKHKKHHKKDKKKAKVVSAHIIHPQMHRRGELRPRVIPFPVGYDRNSFRRDTVYFDGSHPVRTESLFARHPEADHRVTADVHVRHHRRHSRPYQFDTPEYEVDPHHPDVIEYHSARAAHKAAQKAVKKAKKALAKATKPAATASLSDIARLERALSVATQKVAQHEKRLTALEAAIKSGSAVKPATAATASASVPAPVPAILKAGVTNTAACAAQKGVCGTGTCAGTLVHNLCGAGAAVCCVPKAAALPVGEKGLDISVPLTASVAKCLKSSGYSWISIRAGRSTGSVDTNAPASIRTAIAAGFTPSQISVYIFPYSATSDSASGGRQVTAMWNSLASVKDSFSGIWLDIEKATWSTTANNQKFFQSMLTACKATGKTCGVYTSQVYWSQIMGSSYTGGASLPLWYPHYNNVQTLADWAPFGGWTSPYAKQWKGDTTACGIGADLNIKNAAWKSGASFIESEVEVSSASDVTAAQLVACMPGLTTSKANSVLSFVNAAQAQASINTCLRKSAWLAQLGHESNSLVYMQELASGSAYEGRKDLGNTQRGDGVKYKGRGPIQLTGRANYAAAGKALGLDLIKNPTSVATNSVGFRTSAWFWTTKGLNALADSRSFSTITTRINGGQKGAADRNARYAKCKKALGC